MKMRRRKHRSIDQMETNWWGRWMHWHFTRRWIFKNEGEIGTFEAPTVLYVSNRIN